MSMDVGCSGFFGVLLGGFPELQPILDRIDKRLGEEWHDEYDSEPEDLVEAEFGDEIRAALTKSGIVPPEGASIFYSGTDDDRPGRCSTPSEEFGLGHGIFTQPWKYPAMDDSWKKIADFHTWVWGG